jgi:glycine oxidase
VKGQLLHLKAPGGEPWARHNVRGSDVYIVARMDGRVVVGATVEEKGFDTTVTAGGALDLLSSAFEILPGVSELEVTELTAGLRPATPDNAPLLGPTSTPGVIAATGHYRNGVLLAPITAELISRYVLQGEWTAADEFLPQRFTQSSQPVRL